MSKITIITVVRNNEETIKDCLMSVFSQSVHPYEHIVIDGESSDNTVKIALDLNIPYLKLISEKDSGIYDAMNKGINLANGDVVGILNSDDIYNNESVLESITNVFNGTNVDACYSDLLYVSKSNVNEIRRYWRSKKYEDGMFNKGWVPPHPTFFVRRELYEELGRFNLDYNIAADYELMLRFIAKNKIKLRYLPFVTVRMRVGGTTNRSLNNILRQNLEIISALRNNRIHISILFPFYKVFDRILQRMSRPTYELYK